MSSPLLGVSFKRSRGSTAYFYLQHIKLTIPDFIVRESS